VPCACPYTFNRNTQAFTVSFSTFLLLFVNWGEILTCHEDGTSLQHSCNVPVACSQPPCNTLVTPS
jgi:hypothetical protein